MFGSGVVISLLASCPTCWFSGVPMFGMSCLCTLGVLVTGVVTVSNSGPICTSGGCSSVVIALSIEFSDGTLCGRA